MAGAGTSAAVIAPTKSNAAALSLRETLRDLAGAGRAYTFTLVGMVLCGVLFRIVLVAGADPAALSDGRDYLVLAHNLASGQGYVQVYDGETEAFQGFTFRAFRSPGYPLFMAGLYSLLGWRAAVGFAVNVAAELLCQACYVLIAARLLGRGAALVVAVLLAGHVLWTPSLMTESFYSALFALLAMLIVFRVGQGSVGAHCCLGWSWSRRCSPGRSRCASSHCSCGGPPDSGRCGAAGCCWSRCCHRPSP